MEKVLYDMDEFQEERDSPIQDFNLLEDKNSEIVPNMNENMNNGLANIVTFIHLIHTNNTSNYNHSINKD